ncbi:hypothetical protein [Campylobacter sp. MG1]|uniref:hypothetical protein n=1 Tax=Campylobacter sp. MG1 TaxID=2976332 RepID=UPI00226C6727|nr:hypothetical protein [Campylobacter sp. MG1]
MKKLLFLFLLSIFAYSNSSYEIASKLVNDSSKDAKLRLLFPDGSYIKDGKPDIKAINQILKMNSLIAYSYSKVKNMQVKFIANAKPEIFLKSIVLAYEQIGINYYLISEYIKNYDEISIAFKIDSKFNIDSGALYDAFYKMGIRIIDVHKDDGDFIYRLDFSNAKINSSLVLNSGDELELTKPLDPYFIKVVSASKINFDIGLNTLWYPKIEFLDKNLNLIKSYYSDDNTRNLSLEIPKYCEYILVGDKYTLEHIKLGMKIGVQ